MEFVEARYSGQPHIESYGNGGFRFTGGSHSGSLLLLPGGIRAWNVKAFRAGDLHCFAEVFSSPDRIDLFILGSGSRLIFPQPQVHELFKAHGITLECMNTGAACRTYNILLSEGRDVAAGLVAVE